MQQSLVFCFSLGCWGEQSAGGGPASGGFTLLPMTSRSRWRAMFRSSRPWTAAYKLSRVRWKCSVPIVPAPAVRLGCVSFIKNVPPTSAWQKKQVQLQREFAMIGHGFRGIRLTAASISQSTLYILHRIAAVRLHWLGDTAHARTHAQFPRQLLFFFSSSPSHKHPAAFHPPALLVIPALLAHLLHLFHTVSSDCRMCDTLQPISVSSGVFALAKYLLYRPAYDKWGCTH